MVIITHDFSKKNKFRIIIPIFFSNPAFKVGIPVLLVQYPILFSMKKKNREYLYLFFCHIQIKLKGWNNSEKIYGVIPTYNI